MKVCWACENPFPCAEHGREPPNGYGFGGQGTVPHPGCHVPEHAAIEAKVRDLAGLLRVCVELDERADAMKGDLMEAERVLLDQLRYAVRKVVR